MIGIILAGHGEFANGLGSTAAMLIGEQERFEKVNFTPDCTLEGLRELLVAAVDRLSSCDYILVLCDLMGGSPFKCAIELSLACEKLRVISGANMGMIAEAALGRDYAENIDHFINHLVQAGKDSIKYTNVKELQSLENDDFDEL